MSHRKLSQSRQKQHEQLQTTYMKYLPFIRNLSTSNLQNRAGRLLIRPFKRQKKKSNRLFYITSFLFLTLVVVVAVVIYHYFQKNKKEKKNEN